MTESAELFGAIWPIAKGRPPAAEKRAAGVYAAAG